jgi:hypothetical protein
MCIVKGNLIFVNRSFLKPYIALFFTYVNIFISVSPPSWGATSREGQGGEAAEGALDHVKGQNGEAAGRGGGGGGRYNSGH